MLSQTQKDGSSRPIAFASRTLQSGENNYGITELEALAIVWAVKHFSQYLQGHKCHIVTNHKALKSLLNTPHPSGKLARWGLTLQELDLVIIYRPGKRNPKAGALSRYPIPQKQPAETSFGAVVAQVGTPPDLGQEGEPPIEEVRVQPTSEETLMIRQRADPDISAMQDNALGELEPS